MASIGQRWSSRCAFCLWLLLLSIQGDVVVEGQERDERGNSYFDPRVADVTQSCGIPKYQSPDLYFEAREGLCPTRGMALDSISDDDLQALAVEYAPVIFFHPLEKYTLSSTNYTFGDETNGRIYRKTKEDPDVYLVDRRLNKTRLLQTTRDPIYALNPNSFYFETDRAQDMYFSGTDARFGDGYDPETGLSRAPLYYNVYETGHHTWTINYWMYFPYNGEGGLGVLSTYNGTTAYVPFTLKPYGIHEGDWESINVMVCAPENETVASIPTPPLAHKYHQHEWSEINDCTQGQCHFFKGSYHPVGFTALNSHATYSKSVAEMVYTEIDIGFFYSLQAFVVVDRTVFKKADGSYNWFHPETYNLERFHDPHALEEDVEKYFWQGYGGQWGNSEEIKVEGGQPDCLNKEQTEWVPCPTPEEDPIFDIVMQIMDVRPPNSTVLDVVQAATAAVAEIFNKIKKAPIGPGAKGFWERWIPPRNAPFWAFEDNKTLTSQDYCAAKLESIDDTYREPTTEIKHGDLIQQIMYVSIVAAAITALNIIVPLLLMCYEREHPYQPITFDGTTSTPQDPKKQVPMYMLGAWVYSFFYALIVVSGIMFTGSCEALFSTLSDWIPEVGWGSIFLAVEGLGVFIILINTVLLIFMWLQAFEMRNMIRGTYQHILEMQAADEDQGEEPLVFHGDHHYVTWNPRVVEGCFRCSFALLFLSLLFSLICFLVGIMAVGVAFAVLFSCAKLAYTLGNFCFDLTMFGIPKVACGDDFRALCNDWSRVNGRWLLWSGFFAFVFHFYLVAATGVAAQQRRSIVSLLDQYNLVASVQRKSKEGEGSENPEGLTSITVTPAILE